MSFKKVMAYIAVAFVLLCVIGIAYQAKRGDAKEVFPFLPSERSSEPRLASAPNQAPRYYKEQESAGRTVPHQPSARINPQEPYYRYPSPEYKNVRTPSTPVPASAVNPGAYSSANNGSYQAPRSSASSYNRPYSSTTGTNANTSTGTTNYSPVNSRRNAKASSAANQSSVWDEFLPNQTREEKEALDEKLNNLFDGVERAVSQSMAPKSKREANLEKYMPKQAATAAQNGSAAGSKNQTVSNEMASKAAGIVDTVRKQYGDEAASRASSVMDAYQQEMNQVLNTPMSSDEKMAQVQAVNNKYNEKLRNLNQKEAWTKFEQEQRAKNKQQVAEISKTFNAQTAQAADKLMEQYLQKRIAIMKQGLGEEEAYRQLMELEEKQRQDLDNLAKEYNPQDPTASAKMQDLRNKHIQQEIEQDKKDVEAGKKQAQYYRVGKQAADEMDKAWKKENEDIVNSMSMYGPQAQAQAQQILDDMRQKRREIVLQGGSLTDVNDQIKKDTEQANKQLEQIRRDYQEQWIENTQQKLNANNDKALDQYTAQMQNASDKQKEAWKEQARPIMEKYNARRVQVMAQSKDPDEAEAAWRRIAMEELQELQQIQVAAQ